MRKIACIFSFQESSWISCQQIVFNLHKAYESVPGLEIRNFNFSSDSTGADLEATAKDIAGWRPDAIVILDHKPHPISLLKGLIPLVEKYRPRFVFHVFGDFTLYYQEWARLSPLLKDFPVDFLVASDRQKLLIDKLLVPPQESVVVPFPVLETQFSFSSEERRRQRKDWEVPDTDVVFAFTGRLSRQKRIHLLLKTFAEALTKTGGNAHLFIYGLPDHVGDNFLNVWELENEYFRRIHRIHARLPEEIRNRIRFMGNVPNSELRAVYAGADYLVNLSVHNDEDFGMSIAEAQMTGLPAILTDWGGFSSFHHPELPQATRYLEVKIGKRAKLISPEETVAAFVGAIQSSDRIPRERLIELARRKFSVSAVSDKVSAILDATAGTFTSFSELHSLVARKMKLQGSLYLDRYIWVNNLYRTLYSAYVRKS